VKRRPPITETTGPARQSAAVLVSRHWGPIVAVTAVLAGLAIAFGRELWATTALVSLAPFAASAAVVDACYRRVPTSVVALGAGSVAIVLVTGTVITGDVARLATALVAGTVVGLVYLALWRFASVGLGDVRLAALLGIAAGWISWVAVVWFVVGAHLLAGLVAAVLLVRGRRGHMPFGPFLVAGLYLAVALPA